MASTFPRDWPQDGMRAAGPAFSAASQRRIVLPLVPAFGSRHGRCLTLRVEGLAIPTFGQAGAVAPNGRKSALWDLCTGPVRPWSFMASRSGRPSGVTGKGRPGGEGSARAGRAVCRETLGSPVDCWRSARWAGLPALDSGLLRLVEWPKFGRVMPMPPAYAPPAPSPEGCLGLVLIHPRPQTDVDRATPRHQPATHRPQRSANAHAEGPWPVRRRL